MKLLVPCVLLSVLFACVYSAPGPICVCCRDDCKGFEKVGNGDELVRVARSPAGGGDHGEDHSTGLKEIDNGDVLLIVARSLAGGGDHGEDHSTGLKEIDNGVILVRVARFPAGGGDTGEGSAGFTAVDNGDELDIEEDHGTVFEEVDNGDELDIEEDQGAAGFKEVDNGDYLVRLVYTPAGGDDYGAYIGGDGTDDGLKYVPEDIESLYLETIVLG